MQRAWLIFCCAMVFVWLGTLAQRQLHAQRQCHSDAQALCSITRAAFGDNLDFPPGDFVLGLAEMTVAFRYGPLQLLSRAERAQLGYWESMTQTELTNRLVLLRVERVFPFELPRPYTKLAGGKRQTGSGVVLCEAEAEAFAAHLPDDVKDTHANYICFDWIPTSRAMQKPCASQCEIEGAPDAHAIYDNI